MADDPTGEPGDGPGDEGDGSDWADGPGDRDGGSDPGDRDGGSGRGGGDDPDGAAPPPRIEELSRRLRERGRPHAVATVVRREPPVSATVGDRAVVTPDGEVTGWVGGAACAESAVVEAAADALADGESRLLGLAPDPGSVDRPGLDARELTCHGGGSLEVFVEPVLPAPGLLVVGGSPVAAAVADLARRIGLAVTAVDPGAADGDDALATADPAEVVDAVAGSPPVVVATMGEFDARGVAAGLALGAPYVGLVASRRRAGAVAERAADRLDADPAAVREAVTGPAGVEIGAESPAEIALSVLAEVVRAGNDAGPAAAVLDADLRAPDGPGDAGTPAGDGTAGSGGEGDEEDAPADEEAGDGDAPAGEGGDAGSATDPVCGMSVARAEPAATVEHRGETYYFCSGGCADAFRADPGAYA